MAERISRGADDRSKFASQDVEASVIIEDDETEEVKEYGLTELETENTKFNRVDKATATVVPLNTDYVTPRFEDSVRIKINDHPVFYGYVGEVKPQDNLTWELKCFSNIRRLKTTAVNVGTEESFVAAEDILENILTKAGITDYEIHLGILPGIPIERRAVKSAPSFNQPVKFEETQAKALSVIERIAQQTNSVWWFDNTGTFHFGDPETEVYELSYVKDTSAGKTTPPYQTVKVVGGGGASQNAWAGASMLAKSPVRAIRTLENVRTAEQREQIRAQEEEDAQGTSDGDGFSISEDLTERQADVYRVTLGEIVEPVYLYRDKSIHTQKQADAIANALIDKLIQQTRQGWIDIVGWEPIEPFDVVEMPDFLGGEQYLVQGVKHTLGGSDGFMTKIQCGGLVYSGNVRANEGAYSPDDEI